MRSTTSGRGLQPNALSPFDTVVMAVAGSAPAYSLAATTAVLVGAVGLAGPAALLYCAIPMLGIVLAFGRLGRIDVNAGAAYSWVGRTLHPFLGFLSGWALVVAATIFMVAGSLPAGQMTLGLFDPALAQNTALATATGAAWFLLMLGVVLGGARLSARAQLIVSGAELVILTGFGAGALIRIGEGDAAPATPGGGSPQALWSASGPSSTTSRRSSQPSCWPQCCSDRPGEPRPTAGYSRAH